MKTRLLTTAFILLFSAILFEMNAQRPTRIRFARGATSATITGTLRGYKDGKTFAIRVRRGQTLSTTQIDDRHDITIFIQSPSGEAVGDSDASCNNRREITPTGSGDYKLTVVECRKADPWRGTFKFRVTVQ
jgi:hypothetical protein